MRICAGIDVGSRAVKIVLFDSDTRRIVGTGLADQGVHQRDLAHGLLEQTLAEAGLKPGAVCSVVGTGYGRDALDFADTTITEITCHARGVSSERSDARTVIDIGGQDSKLIHLHESGKIRDFVVNDRCAAGTGRFLEVVAGRLEVELGDLGQMSERSNSPASISSMCVVFAETEIIGLLASGACAEDIVAGVQVSIASRISAMAGRRLEEPVVFTGGVALVPGMARALESALGRAVAVVPNPRYTGALGAALLGVEGA
jgi:predicted CoA-substrate-specific enzyme activase